MNERLGVEALVGAKIIRAVVVGSEVRMEVLLANQRTVFIDVMSDPEGNGAGSLHLYAPPVLLARNASSTLIGILGGR